MTNDRIIFISNVYYEKYARLWAEIIEPNERNIKQVDDWKERAELQKKHDLLCRLINEQYDILSSIVEAATTRPTEKEYEWQKNYIRLLRNYIKVLGGNPSIVNFSKISDIG
jgi:hypothetical protein